MRRINFVVPVSTGFALTLLLLFASVSSAYRALIAFAEAGLLLICFLWLTISIWWDKIKSSGRGGYFADPNQNVYFDHDPYGRDLKNK